jgi:hypothetical protein
MSGVLILLLCLSAIGSADVIYFHILKYRLHRQPTCRLEVLSHAGHGLSAAAFFLLCGVEASGRWAWLWFAVIFFQTANQTWDTLLEPRSRRSLGGIPEDEYRLHGVINFLWGGIIVLSFVDAVPRLELPGALGWAQLDGLRWVIGAGTVVSLGFAAFDFWGFFRLSFGRSPATARPVPVPTVPPAQP